ncbi:MAG: hypothetical protein LBB41_05450 [Prevotellaceae bacterium]|jgi:hypothetical protein|nr:hypothetical protein [Prevotellaceae bacterium]
MNTEKYMEQYQSPKLEILIIERAFAQDDEDDQDDWGNIEISGENINL